MASRTGTLSRKARETEWGKESANNVRKYMTDLTKDASKLYKALNKYLPERELGSVMVPVFIIKLQGPVGQGIYGGGPGDGNWS